MISKNKKYSFFINIIAISLLFVIPTLFISIHNIIEQDIDPKSLFKQHKNKEDRAAWEKTEPYQKLCAAKLSNHNRFIILAGIFILSSLFLSSILSTPLISATLTLSSLIIYAFLWIDTVWGTRTTCYQANIYFWIFLFSVLGLIIIIRSAHKKKNL